jgi:hypothetical protein
MYNEYRYVPVSILVNVSSLGRRLDSLVSRIYIQKLPHHAMMVLHAESEPGKIADIICSPRSIAVTIDGSE